MRAVVKNTTVLCRGLLAAMKPSTRASAGTTEVAGSTSASCVTCGLVAVSSAPTVSTMG